jgi:hypothetical protein
LKIGCAEWLRESRTSPSVFNIRELSGSFRLHPGWLEVCGKHPATHLELLSSVQFQGELIEGEVLILVLISEFK